MAYKLFFRRHEPHYLENKKINRIQNLQITQIQRPVLVIFCATQIEYVLEF